MSMLPRIEATELHDRMQRGERVVFVDARNPHAWGDSDVRLPGAVRMPPDEVDQLAAALPKGRPIVAYCT